MATITDPPKQSFKLSMLLYDTRYRSMTIQVVALICFSAFVWWLIGNTAQNLADLGKEPSFRYWIVARIMTVYVEMFRNVPVLLWIVLAMAILIETLPSPRAFRGDSATASMFLDSVAITNRGIYVPAPSFSAGFASSGMSWLLVIAVLVASIFAVRFVRSNATATQNATGVRPTTWPMQLGLLIVPTAIVLFILGLNWTSPELKGFNFTGGLHLRNSLIALWLARAGDAAFGHADLPDDFLADLDGDEHLQLPHAVDGALR